MNRHITSIISRYFGYFASIKFPYPIQIIINWSYCKIFNISLLEFAPISSYRSLTALFTRELKVIRVIDYDNDVLVSPCDSFITAVGDINEGRLFQVKGMSYHLEGLLKGIDSKNISKLSSGKYINFYLSPKDYHRYHIPIDLKVKRVVHVPGKLYPVNMKFLNKMPSLFCENERVIIEASLSNKKLVYIILVGALNVGKMTLSFENRLNTNIKTGDITEFNYDKEIELKKGECFGTFMMGSTIVMLTQKDSINLNIGGGTFINFGDKLANLNS